MDLVPGKGQLEEIESQLKSIEVPYANTLWEHTFMISALSGKGVPALKVQSLRLQ